MNGKTQDYKILRALLSRIFRGGGKQFLELDAEEKYGGLF